MRRKRGGGFQLTYVEGRPTGMYTINISAHLITNEPMKQRGNWVTFE